MHAAHLQQTPLAVCRCQVLWAYLLCGSRRRAPEITEYEGHVWRPQNVSWPCGLGGLPSLSGILLSARCCRLQRLVYRNWTRVLSVLSIVWVYHVWYLFLSDSASAVHGGLLPHSTTCANQPMPARRCSQREAPPYSAAEGSIHPAGGGNGLGKLTRCSGPPTPAQLGCCCGAPWLPEPHRAAG